MCGIVGYVGKDKCVSKIIHGLEALEYRGYDSAGIAIFNKGKVDTFKEQGRIENLKKRIDLDAESHLGIGHTRWATHGEANKINAHPHTQGKFTIVHNGIIENYIELKQDLLKNGYVFLSETDTEVMAALLDFVYKEEKDVLKTIQKSCKMIRGSFALGILFHDNEDTLYATRLSSPLIVASGEEGNFIASDVPAILEFTNKYYLLDDLDIAVLKNESVTIYNQYNEVLKKELLTFEGNMEAGQKQGFEHFMLKEIHEQDNVFYETIHSYFDGSIDSLKQNFPDLSNFKKIDIVACGSAYHTGLVAKSLIEEYAVMPVNVEVASEYRYKQSFYDNNTLVILVSQSGETADTLAALRKAKTDGITTLAIVNVVGSSIAREADHVIYIKAGIEIAVATTKAYLAQLAIFSLLTIYFAYQRKLLKDEQINKIYEDIKKMPNLIRQIVDNQEYFMIGDKVFQHQNIFFIGRDIDYALSMEGSLKLKEISYINSVAYQAGELKHGTISLIEEDTPVIALSTKDELREKTISNIKEVKARGAKVIYVTTEMPKEKFYDEIILIPRVHPILQSILVIIPLQLISYKVAKNKDCDIDKPRNLAKSVTVE